MGSLLELSEVVSVGTFVRFFMISRPQLGKARAKLSQVGLPGKQTRRWRFAHGRFIGERSRLVGDTRRERQEAGLGRRRSWGVIQSQQRSQPIPWGVLKLGWTTMLSRIEASGPDLCTPLPPTLTHRLPLEKGVTSGYFERA